MNPALSLTQQLLAAILTAAITVVVGMATRYVHELTQKHHDYRLSQWAGWMVDAAEQCFANTPGPQKKAWVMGELTRIFPRADPTIMSSVVEAIVSLLPDKDPKPAANPVLAPGAISLQEPAP